MPLIHRDLLAIIFAYSEISRRQGLSLISCQSRKICHSHHYIISLKKRCVFKLFQLAFQSNWLDLIHSCQKNPRLFPFDDVENEYTIFYIAVEQGHLEIVRRLLATSEIDPSDGWSCAIRIASENGHLEILRLLLADERISQYRYNYSIVALSSANGHLEVVKLLLTKGFDPAYGNNQAIANASYNGHLEIVKLLLTDSRVNPADGASNTLRWTLKYGYLAVAKLLLADSRVENSLTLLQFQYFQNQIREYIEPD